MNALLDYPDVWLIGGGGKTSLMFHLASLWARLGQSVICATTTRIWQHQAEQSPDVRIGDFQAVSHDLLEHPAPLVVAARCIEGGKCLGFSVEETLSLRDHASHLVVEADGAAGRPLKAHAPHEPVIASGASCVVAVVGGWSVGAPLDAVHVHRPELFSALSGRELANAVSAQDVAKVVLHPQGWLRAVPAGAAFCVVVTGPDNGIAEALVCHPNAGRMAGVHGWTRTGAPSGQSGS